MCLLAVVIYIFLSRSLTLQSSYYGSHIREAPAVGHHHHHQQQQQSASISTIHHTQATSEILSLTRQDSPDSGFGNGEPQNSPLNPQNSPLVAQQQSPVVVSQQNSPIMAQQHSPMMAQQNSPLMAQQNSPLGSEPQQPLQSLQSAISTCSLSKCSYPTPLAKKLRSLSISLLTD